MIINNDLFEEIEKRVASHTRLYLEGEKREKIRSKVQEMFLSQKDNTFKNLKNLKQFITPKIVLNEELELKRELGLNYIEERIFDDMQKYYNKSDLKSIKEKIATNNTWLLTEKEKAILDDMYDYYEKEDLESIGDKIKRNVRQEKGPNLDDAYLNMLAVNYYAISQESEAILNKLQQRGVEFGGEYQYDSYFFLNKTWYEKFPKEKYIDFVVNNQSALKKFNFNMRFSNDLEKESLINFLGKAVAIDENILSTKESQESYHYGPNELPNLISLATISVFSPEEITKLTDKQKFLLERLYGDNQRKVAEIIKKYPNYEYTGDQDPIYFFTEELFTLFSIDEVATFNENKIKVIADNLNINYQKLSEVYSINKNANVPINWEITNMLSPARILSLSKDAKKKLDIIGNREETQYGSYKSLKIYEKLAVRIICISDIIKNNSKGQGKSK